ncbi:MAG TPA: tetratricopeptide repeat protein [Bryobacteraceae bacterium]|nr:tetratricopeptide repeat protein [Bryobacteraceae bacterium]
MLPQRLHRVLPITIALLTLIAFLPALRNDFVNWDDETNFLENEAYRGLGADQIHWMWTSHLLGRYIPITWMTLGLDYSIWGMEPLGYHLTNIAWHAANAVLFYFLACQLFQWAIPAPSETIGARIPLAAFFAALVFAIHPLRVESVAWITERRDVVSGFFYLAAILVYIRGVRKSPERGLAPRNYWACFALFLLGILSKEIVVTLPVILLILDVYPLGRLRAGWFGREASRVWLEKLPFFAISLADSALALYIGHQEKVTASMAAINTLYRIAISVYGLAFYLWKTVLPFHLSPFYALTPHRIDIRALPLQLSIVVVIWIVAAALLFRRRFPAIPAAALAYGVTLIPVLGFFHNGRQIVADRYSYLACLGFALLAGAVLLLWDSPPEAPSLSDVGPGFQPAAGLLPGAFPTTHTPPPTTCKVAHALLRAASPLLATPAAVALIALLGFLTWRQSAVWQDSTTLWTYANSVDPSYMSFNNLGLAYVHQGNTVAAIEQFRYSIQMDPRFEFSHTNLGGAMLQLHEWDDAEQEFHIALAQKPDLVNAHTGLGYVLMEKGKLDEAIHEFETSLFIDPSYKPAQDNLEAARRLKQSGAQAREVAK